MTRKGIKNLGKTTDVTFSWVKGINPELEQWCSLAEEWLRTVKRAKDVAMRAMGKFLGDYLNENSTSKDPAEFLKRGYYAESFFDAYSGTSGRRIRRHPDSKPGVSGHLVG